jgi:hypothetical protein
MCIGLALPGLVEPSLEHRKRLGLTNLVHYRFRRVSLPST